MKMPLPAAANSKHGYLCEQKQYSAHSTRVAYSTGRSSSSQTPPTNQQGPAVTDDRRPMVDVGTRPLVICSRVFQWTNLCKRNALLRLLLLVPM